MRSRPVALVAALVVSSTATLAAQECVGIPKGGKGFFAAGPSGTDGASGTGLSFAYTGANQSLQVTRQSLGVFAHDNPQRTTSALASRKVKALRGCLTLGASWQTWDTEGAESTMWSIDDPEVLWERHSIGGGYSRFRLPLGLSFGRTYDWKRVSFTPFVNPYVLYERESLRSHDPNSNGATTIRSSFGGGLTAGVALRAGWFVARPTINITNTRDRALSGKKNFAEFVMHFGVVF